MLRWTALGGMNVSQRLPHQQPASTPPVFSSQKVSTCREERHKLSFLSPPTAISSRWRWNSVFRNPSNTCQNETGHLVPLPGEHSISRTCKYRGTCNLLNSRQGWLNQQLLFVLYTLQSFFHYLPHLAGTRPQVAPSQVNMRVVTL